MTAIRGLKEVGPYIYKTGFAPKKWHINLALLGEGVLIILWLVTARRRVRYEYQLSASKNQNCLRPLFKSIREITTCRPYISALIRYRFLHNGGRGRCCCTGTHVHQLARNWRCSSGHYRGTCCQHDAFKNTFPPSSFASLPFASLSRQDLHDVQLALCQSRRRLQCTR